jgi:hypothetical protein
MYGTILCLAAAIVVAMPLFSASAQSGRVQTPQPTPSPQVTSPDAKSSFRVYGSAEKYRLVYPTNYDGILRKGKLSYADAETGWARPSIHNSFIEQLNKAGEQGYRLIAAIGDFPVAIVKQDETQYEYAWFETNSDSFKCSLEDNHAELAKRGFHVVGKFFIRRDCWPTDNNEPIIMRCLDRELFLLEREKGGEKPVPFMVAESLPRWKTSKQRELLQTQIDEKLAEGFYPTHLLSKYEILLEKTAKAEELLAGKTDVRVVATSLWHDDVEKKVNELAQQGYRLALVNKGIALMYRPAETATPVSYVWLDATKKEFENQLAKLQEQGAVYRMTYPNDNGTENRLIFELKPVDDGTRREYRVLKLTFQNMENAAEKKVQTDLDPPSKESIKILNGLVKEGFAVRDLFVSDAKSVLLERPR